MARLSKGPAEALEKVDLDKMINQLLRELK